jgi:hypothetical protein
MTSRKLVILLKENVTNTAPSALITVVCEAQPALGSVVHRPCGVGSYTCDLPDLLLLHHSKLKKSPTQSCLYGITYQWKFMMRSDSFSVVTTHHKLTSPKIFSYIAVPITDDDWRGKRRNVLDLSQKDPPALELLRHASYDYYGYQIHAGDINLRLVCKAFDRAMTRASSRLNPQSFAPTRKMPSRDSKSSSSTSRLQ